MAQINNVFQRIEKKYLLDDDQYNEFLQGIEPYMTLDEYGLHTICNIYYDTDQYELVNKSLEKPVYKEKFRVRCYGIPNEESKIFLEIKKKYKGVVFKRRTSLTLREAKAYLEEGMKPAKSTQIMSEIDYFLGKYQPEPKLFLAYDRLAYYGTQDPEIRMTFDARIRSREDDLSLELGDHGELLLPENMHLLEIKVNAAMPMWLAHTLSELQIYPVSFSKYGNIYKKNHAPSKLIYGVIQTNQMEDEECLQVLLNQGI
jgi:SPX domain protein involved in polyphosphate accumulation